MEIMTWGNPTNETTCKNWSSSHFAVTRETHFYKNKINRDIFAADLHFTVLPNADICSCANTLYGLCD